eukprot:COSAG06_NODE_15884_length_1037_cov_2.299574_3_plen_70_part_01
MGPHVIDLEAALTSIPSGRLARHRRSASSSRRRSNDVSWLALAERHIGQFSSSLAPNKWAYLVARHFAGI